MVMFISEISVYEFLKDKLKFIDSDAKKYAKEMGYIEEKLHIEIKEGIFAEMKIRDFSTKLDLKELEVKMERGFKNIIIWIIGFAAMVIGGFITLANLLSH